MQLPFKIIILIEYVVHLNQYGFYYLVDTLSFFEHGIKQILLLKFYVNWIYLHIFCKEWYLFYFREIERSHNLPFSNFILSFQINELKTLHLLSFFNIILVWFYFFILEDCGLFLEYIVMAKGFSGIYYIVRTILVIIPFFYFYWLIRLISFMRKTKVYDGRKLQVFLVLLDLEHFLVVFALYFNLFARIYSLT